MTIENRPRVKVLGRRKLRNGEGCPRQLSCHYKISVDSMTCEILVAAERVKGICIGKNFHILPSWHRFSIGLPSDSASRASCVAESEGWKPSIF
jgi:hypothetical protein